MYTNYSKDQVIDKVTSYINEHNYIPTKRELIKNTDLTNQNFTNSGGYLKLLEGLGYTHSREMTKKEVLQKLSDYLSALDYVPYQREIYENKIVHYTTVEYFGLVGYKKYEEKMQKKLEILNSNNISYIAIYPSNINHLDFVFSKYLERKVV